MSSMSEEPVVFRRRGQLPHLTKEPSAFDRLFYKPHTVTVLIVLLASIVYVGFTDAAAGYNSTKVGLCAVAIVFLVFCMLNLSDGPFIRPHPAVWRVVLGISVLYLSLLVFLLFQSVEDVRDMVATFGEGLGRPLPERGYADDCQLYTPHDSFSSFRNLRDALFDEFVIAHTLGWMAKMVMLRDYKLAWVLSVVFEFLEYSFEHMLPNFGECWWDHFILDVLVCNLLGMIVGMYIVRYFSMKTYDWIGFSDVPTIPGKMRRAAMQFTPESWTSFRWDTFSSFKRFCYIVMLLVAVEANELAAFFLKAILWIPPPHPLNTGRLFMWWLIALPSLREYYQFVVDPHCKRFGAQLWITTAALFCEILLCVKFGHGMFPNPAPAWVVWTWLTIVVAAIAYWSWRFASDEPVLIAEVVDDVMSAQDDNSDNGLDMDDAEEWSDDRSDDSIQ